MTKRISKTENGGYVKTSVAVVFCQLHGYEITRQGLIQMGRKHGWSNKKGFRLYFDIEKIKKHIMEIQQPHEEWIPLPSAYWMARNKSDFYRRIHEYEIEIRKFTRHGEGHARKNDLERIFG